jgi:hypothetical protein
MNAQQPWYAVKHTNTKPTPYVLMRLSPRQLAGKMKGDGVNMSHHADLDSARAAALAAYDRQYQLGQSYDRLEWYILDERTGERYEAISLEMLRARNQRWRDSLSVGL